jgi:4-amino-4-deoxy-L-arabinose transferase-like glycosyltransferase
MEVPPKIPRLWWIVVPLAYILYLHGLSTMGLLGPDEPRYASIGREMARSGDWITPRLWGAAWFEKPALLYWLTGLGFKAGLGPDLAPRVPVALCAIGFLAFFWWILRREFGPRVGWYGVLILGTSGGWVGYSNVGVTDVPLTVAYSAAMLLGMAWMEKGDRRMLLAASALLGVAVLAKGLVPLVLVVPLLWMARRRWRDLLSPAAWLPFAAVALPWYLLCYQRNGRAFTDKFFLEHTFGRFYSPALQHVQPWWFYLPVLLAGLLPWTPLLIAAVRRHLYAGARVRLLLGWALFGLVFFSASTNKLPGYLLPLLPAVAALMAVSLDALRDARLVLGACGILLISLLLAAPVLPAALSAGLSRAPRPGFSWTWLLPFAVAAAVWYLEVRNRRPAAVLVVAVAATAGFLALKVNCGPEIDRLVSARSLWREVAARRGEVCVGDIHRSWRYGLNYYSVVPLPECAAEPRPWRVEPASGRRPLFGPAGTVPAAAPSTAWLAFVSSGVVLSPFRN